MLSTNIANDLIENFLNISLLNNLSNLMPAINFVYTSSFCRVESN